MRPREALSSHFVPGGFRRTGNRRKSSRSIPLAIKLLGRRVWLTTLLARRPTKVAAIALANKMARMACAMMARGDCYKEPVALAA